MSYKETPSYERRPSPVYGEVGGYNKNKKEPAVRRENPIDIILPVIVHAFNERKEA